MIFRLIIGLLQYGFYFTETVTLLVTIREGRGLIGKRAKLIKSGVAENQFDKSFVDMDLLYNELDEVCT